MRDALTLYRTLHYILHHPLNRRQKGWAIKRYLWWQIRTRIRQQPVSVPFVNGTHLFLGRGMAGGTGSVYCGLHEYNDMAFVLHCLRPDDLFVDIGANIGVYTVLAAGAVGARVVAFEPGSSAYKFLEKNIALNNLASRVQALPKGVGSTCKQVTMTAAHDIANRVLEDSEIMEDTQDQISVEIVDLDSCLGDHSPGLIKIDVEGYEGEVLAGADGTLAKPGLMAVIVEMNGSGSHFGYTDRDIHDTLSGYGYHSCRYDVEGRCLEAAVPGETGTDNVIYVRNKEEVGKRLRSAPGYLVHRQLV